MTIVNEGDQLSVLDDTKLVSCIVSSKYMFKERVWLVLIDPVSGRQFRRPETLFIKPDKGIKLAAK